MFKKKLFLIFIITIPLNASWTEDTFNTLSLDQKIGQLFIVDAACQESSTVAAALTYKSDSDLLYRCQPEYVERMIKEYHVGGLIFLNRSSATALVNYINRYQKKAEIPLLIALDAEWGLSMRLDSTIGYPRAMTLGALRDPGLIYDVAYEVGKQCKALGVHMNIAPVVDVNNNPANPIISDRSFGESKEEVARRATLFMHGLRDARILSCAKHFPGHGDTTVDSHCDLPIINHSIERLTAIELYPFQQLIAAGVPAIMTAHLHIPALDDQAHMPATLSKKIITNLLRNELGFKGLIITDGMVMAGITKHHQPGYADLQAIMAGNDLIIRPTDVPKAVELIKQALADGALSMEELDAHVLRILRAKENAGTHQWQPLDAEKALTEINTPYARELKQQAFTDAITVVAHHKQLPLKSSAPIAYLQIGAQNHITVKESLTNAYNEVISYWLPANAAEQAITSTLDALMPYQKIVVGIFEMNKYAAKNYGIFPSTLQLLTKLYSIGKEVVIILFGNPYSLKMFNTEQAIIMAYEDDIDAQQAVADVISGKRIASGTLPVTI